MKNFQYVKEFFGVITPEASVDGETYIVMENDEIFPCRLKEQDQEFIEIDDELPTVVILKKEYGECFIYKGNKENIVECLDLKKGISIIWPKRKQVILQGDFEVRKQEKISVKSIKNPNGNQYQIKLDGVYHKCKVIRKRSFSVDINDKIPSLIFNKKAECNIIKKGKMGTAILGTLKLDCCCVILPKQKRIIKELK